MSNENNVEFIEEVLQAHNICRMRHGVPPLRLDEQLCQQSQEIAEVVLFADNNVARFHGAGENIFVLTIHDPGYCPKGDYFVNYWYQQRNGMTFSGDEKDYEQSLNFTQVVWKASEELGVGIAQFDDKLLVVCQYMPPGNILGEFPENVFPEVNPVMLQGNEEIGEEEPALAMCLK